jgi:phage-related protein
VDFIAPSPFFKSQQGFYYESPTEITLDGNAPCYPIITLVGPIDHPLITVSNSSGTYTLDLGNLVIASGSNVTIDPGYGEIEPYGYMMQIKGSFPVFMPGLNTISVNGSFNIRGNASWR